MVKHWIKSILTAAVAGAMMLGTTGCGVGFTLSPDELYRLPKLPAEYTELDKQLSAMISAGAEYAPPAAGTSSAEGVGISRVASCAGGSSWVVEWS